MKRESLTDEEVEELKETVEKDLQKLNDAKLTATTELALRKKYSPPEWALFYEFQVKQGGRRADCIALNTWPSRDFKVIGFEIKASRSDWKREMRESAKNDMFVGQCDEFYLVTAKKGILKDGELPNGWGHLRLTGSGLRKEEQSNLTEAQDQPMKKAFWAKLAAKAFDDGVPNERINAAKRQGFKEGKERASNTTDYSIQRLRRKAEKWDEVKDSPLDLLSFDTDTLQEIQTARDFIEKVEGGGYAGFDQSISGIETRLERMVETLEEIENLREDLERKVKE